MTPFHRLLLLPLAAGPFVCSARAECESLLPFRSTPGSLGAIADFDGDGILDTAAQSAPSTLAFARGRGDGSFEPAVEFALPGDAGTAVLAGDLDGDGRADAVLVPNAMPTGTVFVARGGPGGFASIQAISLAPASFSTPRVLADLTGDGVPDLAAPTTTFSILVFPGNGTGGFLAPIASPIIVNATLSGETGDVDGDGDLDLFAAGSTGTAVVAYENQAGTLTERLAATGLVAGFYGLLAVADFSGDGRADVALGLPAVGLGTGLTRVALALSQSAPGSLQLSALAPVATLPYVIASGARAAAGDVDLDGRTDLAAAASSQGAPGGILLRGAASPSGFLPLQPLGLPLSTGLGFADFDQDGRLDLVAGAIASIAVALDAASAGFGLTQVEIDNPIGSALAAGDFDADGLPDLVAEEQGDGALRLWKGDGAGGIAPSIVLGVPGGVVTDVVAADHDGDGDADLYVHGAVGMQVYRNDGAGPFALLPAAAAIDDFVFDIAVGDLVGDARPDVARAASGGFAVSQAVPLGLGPATFVPATAAVKAVAIGDATGDGIADVVATEEVSAIGPGLVAVYAGSAGGNFALAFSAGIGGRPSGVAAGDFDRDGDADCAAVAAATKTLHVLQSSGSSLATVQTFPLVLSSATVRARVTARDLTGDGWLDLAVFEQDATAFRVFLGRADGTFADGGAFATSRNWRIAPADFDQDGRQDVATLGSFARNLAIALGNDGALGTSAYGAGKAGALGVPGLLALGAPLLGSATGLRIDHGLPGAAPVLFIGMAAAALPFDLGTLLVVPAVILPLPAFSAAGVLDLPAVLPASTALCGVDLYSQALFVDPAAAGPYHTAQTPGLKWTLGF